MEKTLSFMAEVNDKEKDKRVEKIMEEVLGISLRTKLEKLADSFTGVRYCIHPDKENKDIGFINFAYTGDYIIKQEKSEIQKVAEKFYNKDDYIVCVAATSDYGFDIVIFDNFIKSSSKKDKKKAN